MFNIPLIETCDLESLIKSDNITLIHCKDSELIPTSSIPGSHSANMNIPYRELQDYFQKLIISSQDIIVCYGTGSLEYAARMWWGLKGIGLQNVVVLNGGLNSWQQNCGTCNELEYSDLIGSYKDVHKLEDYFFIYEHEMANLSEDVYEIIHTTAEENNILATDGTLLPNGYLIKYLKAKGVCLRDTKLTICTGDYACTLLFGLACIGRKRLALLVEENSFVKRRSISLSGAPDFKSMMKIRTFVESVKEKKPESLHYSMHQDLNSHLKRNDMSRRSTGEETYKQDEEKRCWGCCLL